METLGAGPKAKPWGGARCEPAELPFAGIEERLWTERIVSYLDISEARDWAGVKWLWPEPFEVPADFGRADLEFSIFSGDGEPLPPLQVAVGKISYVPTDSLLTAAGRVAFPLDLSEGGLHAPFASVSLQLIGERPEGTSADILVGGFRVVMRGGPEESPLALRRLRAKGSHGVEAIRRDGGIELAVDDKTEDWGYAWLSPLRPVALPEDSATAVLAFEVNGGRTPLGRRDTGRQRFRVQLTCPTPEKKDADGPWVRDPPVEDGQVDDDPNSWQTVRIPLAKLLPEGATAIARITLQYTGLPSTGRAGLIVRNFRFEPVAP